MELCGCLSPIHRLIGAEHPDVLDFRIPGNRIHKVCRAMAALSKADAAKEPGSQLVCGHPLRQQGCSVIPGDGEHHADIVFVPDHGIRLNGHSIVGVGGFNGMTDFVQHLRLGHAAAQNRRQKFRDWGVNPRSLRRYRQHTDQAGSSSGNFPQAEHLVLRLLPGSGGSPFPNGCFLLLGIGKLIVEVLIFFLVKHSHPPPDRF